MLPARAVGDATLDDRVTDRGRPADRRDVICSVTFKDDERLRNDATCAATAGFGPMLRTSGRAVPAPRDERTRL